MEDFDRQRYPTVEETITYNASVLYKRKKYFLGNLRLLFDGLGYVIIAMVYLRDVSFSFCFLRCFVHFCISNPYPAPTPTMTLDETTKKRMSKFLLVSVIGLNAWCFIWHLLLGVYTKSSSEADFLYGSVTIQFIGEGLPYSRFGVLMLDLLCFLVQVAYHSLQCATDDSEVLKASVVNEETTANRLEIEADGYNGNVSLITIDLWESAKQTLSFRNEDNYSFWQSARQDPMVGSFI